MTSDFGRYISQKLSITFFFYFKLDLFYNDYELIMLVGTDVCVRMVLVWEETGVHGGNPPV